MFRIQNVELKDGNKVVYKLKYRTVKKDSADKPPIEYSLITVERQDIVDVMVSRIPETKWVTELVTKRFVCFDVSLTTSFTDSVIAIKGVRQDGTSVMLYKLNGITGKFIFNDWSLNNVETDEQTTTTTLCEVTKDAVIDGVEIKKGDKVLVKDVAYTAEDVTPEKHKHCYVYKLFSAVSKYINKGYSSEVINRKIQESNLAITATDRIDIQLIMVSIIDSINSTDTVEEAIEYYIQENILDETSDYFNIYTMLNIKASMRETHKELNTRGYGNLEEIIRVQEFIQYMKAKKHE